MESTCALPCVSLGAGALCNALTKRFHSLVSKCVMWWYAINWCVVCATPHPRARCVWQECESLWCFRPQPRNESERPTPDNFIAAVPTSSHQIMAKAGIYPLAHIRAALTLEQRANRKTALLQKLAANCLRHALPEGGKSAPHFWRNEGD
jgi:hypothetical protein